jgi:hypothetical protein
MLGTLINTNEKRLPRESVSAPTHDLRFVIELSGSKTTHNCMCKCHKFTHKGIRLEVQGRHTMHRLDGPKRLVCVRLDCSARK